MLEYIESKPLSKFLKKTLPAFLGDVHPEIFVRILQDHTFKMELLNLITTEIIDRSRSPKQPFDIGEFLLELISCPDLRSTTVKLTQTLMPNEKRLLNFLRLFPSHFRYDECLAIKDEEFGEEMIERALTNLYHKDIVRKDVPGSFLLADVMRAAVPFGRIPQVKKEALC